MPSPIDTELRVQLSPVPTQTMFGIAGIERDRADRLHGLLVEHGLEGRAAVERLPDAAGGRADVDASTLPSFSCARGERRDAAAHRGRADVARAETGDDGAVE